MSGAVIRIRENLAIMQGQWGRVQFLGNNVHSAFFIPISTKKIQKDCPRCCTLPPRTSYLEESSPWTGSLGQLYIPQTQWSVKKMGVPWDSNSASETRQSPRKLDWEVGGAMGGVYLIWSKLKPGSWKVEGLLGTYIPVASQVLSTDEYYSFHPALKKIRMGDSRSEFYRQRYKGWRYTHTPFIYHEHTRSYT